MRCLAVMFGKEITMTKNSSVDIISETYCSGDLAWSCAATLAAVDQF